jgi:hypothetical protein
MTDNLPTGNAIVCDRCSGPLRLNRRTERDIGIINDTARWKAVIGCPACNRSLSGTGPEAGDAVAAAIRRWQDRLAAKDPA